MRKQWAKSIFWIQHPWPKCALHTFISRVNKHKDKDWSELIVPHIPRVESKTSSIRSVYDSYDVENKASRDYFYKSVQKWIKPDKAIRKWITIVELYPEEYGIYKSYPWPKCSFSTFLTRYKGRIWRHMSIEKCLKPKDANNYIIWKTHAEAKIIKPESYYLIEITYPKEEAKIFHKIYRNMIEELELKIFETKEPHEAKIYEQKLNETKKQYSVFLTFNPL